MNINDFIKTATIGEISARLKNKDFTCVELTAAYLKRAKEFNPALSAFITITEESAMNSAMAADNLILKGVSAPLTGVPLAIKDNICLMGAKTTCGSKMLEDFIPHYDATAAKKLKKAGAVIIGKTNMDEFAMGGSSTTSYFGAVHNPYNPKKVAGGSSGGSAAAVAAALCPASLGSDTGGSVRQPAAFCGVTGLKPTYGRVSRFGLVAFASSLEQIGPMARNAEDCGILLGAIAGKDELDATTFKTDDTDFTAKIGGSLKGKVIALPKEFFESQVSDSVKTAVMTAAETYAKMGCTLKEVSLPSLKYAVAAYYLISSAEAASNLSRFDGIKYGYRSKEGATYEEQLQNTRREGFGWEVKRRIMLGNYALSSGYYDAYYNRAVKIRSKIKAELDQILKVCDFILTPTAPTTAYDIGSKENDAVAMYSSDICTVVANISGLPAISTTCGYDQNGLPIGMSLMGRAFDEAEIIFAADCFEKTFERREATV